VGIRVYPWLRSDWQMAMVDECFYPHGIIKFTLKKVNARKRQQFGRKNGKSGLARRLQ
jgi:hypothetical protein